VYKVVALKNGTIFRETSVDWDGRPFSSSVAAIRWIEEVSALVPGGTSFTWEKIL